MPTTLLNCIVSLLLAVPAAALAQSGSPAAAPPAVYTGPRFPGGPDSLRALVYRATRQAGAAPAGKMTVRLELKDGRQPQGFELLTPPDAVSSELKQAATRALTYLQAHMPAWQPGTPDPDDKSGTFPKISLPLDFTGAQAVRPYNYADQMPVFPNVDASLQSKPAKRRSAPANLANYTTKNIIWAIQKQCRYPAEDLRQNRQGVVYAYFEVAENGALEGREILGTVSPSLDAEVLGILNRLPSATTPALLQGRPVRVYYVLPITFKIQ